MPANRNALVRYKTIDKCLQNRYRQWTLEDLIDACSDALYEYEGMDKPISKRSIQGDIQVMRSDKLGYNAPIIVVDRKYYTYEDPDYSITNIPITDQDLGKLSEAVSFLKQFQGFSHFRELNGMIQKLEDHVYSAKTHQKPVIDFEKNENLKGLEYLDELYQAIIQRNRIALTYQSFKARQAQTFDFEPYLLKEFRNRWFLIGVKKGTQNILNLALDRIVELKPKKDLFHPALDFDAESHFKNAIGVTVNPTGTTEEVLLFVTHLHAPYVLTKPMHHSQKLVEKDNYGIVISLNVQHNFELEKMILGFGDGMKVIAPERLKRNIRDRMNAAIDLYQTEMNESGLKAAQRRLENKGFSVLNFVFTKREVRKIGSLLDKYFKKNTNKTFAKRRLLQDIPQLQNLLLNKNLMHIVRNIDPDAFLTRSIFFEKSPVKDWYVTWHQDQTISVASRKVAKGYSGWTKKDGVIGVVPPKQVLKNNFTIRIHLDDTTKDNGALKVVPGSHNKKLSKEEIILITENCVPSICEVGAGGIQLMKPLLLHASSKVKQQKRRRVIHLEFSSYKLGGGLEWGERVDVVNQT